MKAKRPVPVRVATLVRAWARIPRPDGFMGSPAAALPLQRRVPQGRCGRWRRFCCAILCVQLPKDFPKVFLERMQIGIARHDTAEKRPVACVLDERSANRIFQHIKAHPRKDAPPAHMLAEDSIAGLMLEFMRCEERIEILTQEFHRIELITRSPQTHPHEMRVIGHETVCGATQGFSHASVQDQLTAFLMEQLVQPALLSLLKGLRPMNHCMSLILVTFQPGQMILVAFGIHLHLIASRWDSDKPGGVPVRARAEFMGPLKRRRVPAGDTIGTESARIQWTGFGSKESAHALTSVATNE